MEAPSQNIRQLYRSGPEDVPDLQRVGGLLGEESKLGEQLVRYTKLFYARVAANLTDPRRAATTLGPRVVAQVAVQHTLVRSFRRIPEGIAHRLWSDCIHRALAARLLAVQTGAVQPDVAFTGGLALEWGIGALIEESGQHLRWLAEGRPQTGEARLKSEVELFGRTHIQGFLTFAHEWGLPEQIVTAVATHHDGTEGGDMLARVLAWADRLGEAITAPAASHELEGVVQRAASLGVHPNDAWVLVERVLKYTPHVAQVLGVEVYEQPTLAELRERSGDYTSVVPDTDWVTIIREENEALRAQVSELTSDIARLRRQDTLTGLPTHSTFLELASEAVHRAQRDGLGVSLLLVDIDGFRALNSRYGYAAGDRLLTLTAARLRGVTREDNLIARVGPDSFAILVPGDQRIAQVIAERARATVEAITLDDDGHRIRSTATVFGVSIPEQVLGRDHGWLMGEAHALCASNGHRLRNRTVWGS